jgi:hypothetical protein
MLLGLLFIRTSPVYLAFGVFIGVLNYRNTEQFRRSTGKSPWGIPPVVWGVASVFVSLFITLLALIAMHTSRASGVSRGGGIAQRGMRPPFDGQVPGGPTAYGPGEYPDTQPAGEGTSTVAAPPMASAPPSWQADPSGRFDFRYWGGDEWTEFVSKDGEQSTDPF